MAEELLIGLLEEIIPKEYERKVAAEKIKRQSSTLARANTIAENKTEAAYIIISKTMIGEAVKKKLTNALNKKQLKQKGRFLFLINIFLLLLLTVIKFRNQGFHIKSPLTLYDIFIILPIILQLSFTIRIYKYYSNVKEELSRIEKKYTIKKISIALAPSTLILLIFQISLNLFTHQLIFEQSNLSFKLINLTKKETNLGQSMVIDFYDPVESKPKQVRKNPTFKEHKSESATVYKRRFNPPKVVVTQILGEKENIIPYDKNYQKLEKKDKRKYVYEVLVR